MCKRLTVGELKKLLSNVPDDETVVIEIGGDEFSYGMLYTAEEAEANEDWGFLITCEKEMEKLKETQEQETKTIVQKPMTWADLEWGDLT